MKKLLLILLCLPMIFSCEFFSKEDSIPSNKLDGYPSTEYLEAEYLEDYNRLIERTGSRNAASMLLLKLIQHKELTSKELAMYIESFQKIDLIRENFLKGEQSLDALDGAEKIKYKDEHSFLKHFTDDFLDKAFGYNLQEIRDSLSNN